jgi:hypothetical protein
MSEVEKKRLILYYTTNARKQFGKLLVLLKWASNAKNIQTCQVRVMRDISVRICINTSEISNKATLDTLYTEHHGVLIKSKQSFSRYCRLFAQNTYRVTSSKGTQLRYSNRCGYLDEWNVFTHAVQDEGTFNIVDKLASFVLSFEG